MSYIINKTDGSVLTEVVDGTIDQIATDLTLVGKNATSYGEFFNENYVHLLENFANTSQPNRPIAGQLWFDSAENRLKVYDGNGFKSTSGTIVSQTVPSSISQGDLWIDSLRQQLYFNDGTATLLAGPIYTAQQGYSGYEIDDILDADQNVHTVMYVYLAKTLLGVFSRDQFTPAAPVPGIDGDINVGFTASNISGYKFHARVTSSDALVDSFGNLVTVNQLLKASGDSTSTGSIRILNNKPLVLGTGTQIEIGVTDTLFSITSNKSNQNFELATKNAGGSQPSFFINAQNQYVGLGTTTPITTLDVRGDARITGSLTVEGEVTTINSTNLAIQDKLIELAKINNPSNSTADGGGISVKGSTDKTLIYVNATGAWTSSETFDIASGKTYQINGTTVISSTALGSTIASAPALTSVGNLLSVQAGNINISTNNVISFVNAGITNGDIILTPKGAGNVSVSGRKITNLASPSDSTDAVPLGTLNATVRSASLAFSADTTGLTNLQIASSILAIVYPVLEHDNGTICRMWCASGLSHTIKQFQILNGLWTYIADL
jgi:hypothetical protein